jgi:hypothetical protein
MEFGEIHYHHLDDIEVIMYNHFFFIYIFIRSDMDFVSSRRQKEW